MRINPMKHKLCTAVTMATSLLAADIALAQAPALEEVVVTARKRAENLQDVPMAVSAFSNEQLQIFAIEDLTEVARMTPNLTMNETSGLVGGAIQVYMRGIGNDPGIDQGVGIYVDDVYLNRTSGSLLDVFDVERIEVLKGPQGSLYGRNTIGGAIKYITREPGEEFEGGVEVKGGSDSYVRIKGRLSGPLMGDTLLGGLAFSYRERDGYQDNSFAGSDDPWDTEAGALRGTLVWKATESLKLKLAADYSKDESLPPIPGRIFVDEGAAAQVSPLLTTANAVFGPGTALYDTPQDTSLPNDEDDVSSAFVDTFDKFEIEQTTVALTAEWDLNDQWLLKSVTAGRFLEQNQPFDFDGSEQQWINTYRDGVESDDISQELQLNFTGDNITAVMGLYYLTGEQTQDSKVTLQTARLLAVSNKTTDTYKDDRDLDSYSAYGNVDWNFAEDWQLSVGARYSYDEKKQTIKANVTEGYYALAFSSVTPPQLPMVILPGQEATVEASPLFTFWAANNRYLELSYAEDSKADDDWDEFTPSIRLAYDVNDDTMAYGAITTGFKSGGFNNTGGNAESYDSETVTTYALGLKATMLDDTLRINTELFYNDYEDKQASAIQLIDDDLSLITRNVGEVTQYGGEFEVTWLPPVEGLMINFNVGYLDSDVDEFNTAREDPVTGENISGDFADSTELGYTPEWTGQLRATYDMQLGDMGYLTFGSDVSYRDEMYTNSPIDTTKEYKTVQVSDDHYIWNAGVAFRSMDERWRIAVEGKNLNDERVIANSYDIQVVSTAGYNPPRTWAVSVGYEF